ncbi:NAD(P)/FAD-dependent oxidoreductase [Solimicrobium silvestre]|uniref:Glycine/D-amino acid oxidases (Deaminating) n=1 Tax=Solimicrobium silvestre TaxID=2099400 RepID=A0A2S9GXM5_9BURK|nr:FAD-dependent oxidoreductase [Solimicrobium silvestre]PRC92475.1 Glycine/D-amino acid oxidases (deaminating) [Solimicrobium silvestre]
MSTDVLVIGAGIVGAACARALQQRGLSVALVDATTPGAGVTAAGMGHLVVLDHDETELCLFSMRLWREFNDAHPEIGEFSRCGTLWVAENETQLQEALQRAERYSQRGWNAEFIQGKNMRQLEPQLRSGLCGGVLVSNDAVVFPPKVAQFLAMQCMQFGGKVHLGQRVVALTDGAVELANGVSLTAKHIVLATGVETAQLLPEVPVFARKGHLAITDRYPGLLQHQIVNMNYGQIESGSDNLAVAANVQARPNGQWLVGSCRQDGQLDTKLDFSVLSKVLLSAIELLPCLSEMRILRAWAGMRPATPDGHPLIGPHPFRPGLWLATGHEGLGITTAFATAEILADQIMRQPGSFDASAYLPSRFSMKVDHAA